MPAKKTSSKKQEIVTADDLVKKEGPASGTPVKKDEPKIRVDGRSLPDAHLPTQYTEGILDTTPEGHGFLRPKFTPSNKDIYISASQIRRFRLREGDMVGGQVRSPKENERYHGILKIEKVRTYYFKPAFPMRVKI